jgi:hypothetical protein
VNFVEQEAARVLPDLIRQVGDLELIDVVLIRAFQAGVKAGAIEATAQLRERLQEHLGEPLPLPERLLTLVDPLDP